MNLNYTIKGDIYIYKENKNFFFFFYKGKKNLFLIESTNCYSRAVTKS